MSQSFYLVVQDRDLSVFALSLVLPLLSDVFLVFLLFKVLIEYHARGSEPIVFNS